MKKIVIYKTRTKEKLTGVVRIDPEAEKIIRSICMERDMKASDVASQIIVQAAPYIQFKIKEE